MTSEQPGWTIGYVEDNDGVVNYVGGRELSDAELSDYRDHVAFAIAHEQQPALRLVMGNYQEYRAVETSAALLATTSNAPPAHYMDALFQLQRILLNWLTSLRLLDDHTFARLTRIYGPSSGERQAYAVARARVYDANAGYRFMMQLRNYAQHCGAVPIHGHAVHTSTGRSFELCFERDELLASFDGWKTVKVDLARSTDSLPVDDLLEQAMTGVLELVTAIREIDQPRYEACQRAISDMVAASPQGNGRQPAIFRMRLDPEAADGETMKLETVPVAVVNRATSGPSSTGTARDFRAERPAFERRRLIYQCQGPLDKVTQLPRETCGTTATSSFFFPHQHGIAFLFGCDIHALSLGQWAGRKFGGSFGGEVAKAALVIEQAEGRGVAIHFPHGEEYATLLPVATPAPGVAPLWGAIGQHKPHH